MASWLMNVANEPNGFTPECTTVLGLNRYGLKNTLLYSFVQLFAQFTYPLTVTELDAFIAAPRP